MKDVAMAYHEEYLPQFFATIDEANNFIENNNEWSLTTEHAEIARARREEKAVMGYIPDTYISEYKYF